MCAGTPVGPNLRSSQPVVPAASPAAEPAGASHSLASQGAPQRMRDRSAFEKIIAFTGLKKNEQTGLRCIMNRRGFHFVPHATPNQSNTKLADCAETC